MRMTILEPSAQLSLLLLAGWLAAADAPAQSRQCCLPRGYEWIEASSYQPLPFGWKGGRYQQLWGPADIPGNQPLLLIKELYIRRDCRGKACPSFWVECEMGFSSTTANPRKPSATFAANLGKDYATVLGRKRITLPATPAGSGKGPLDWLPAIALDRPYVVQKQGLPGLLWEMKVHGADPASPGSLFTLDGVGMLMMIGFPGGEGPDGCPALKAGPPLACDSYCYLGPGGTSYMMNISNAPPGGSLLLALGQSSWSFGGLPLPLDLGPLGAPGCKVYTDIWMPLPTRADNAGRASLQLPLPTGAGNPGIMVYSQAYALAPGVNALGLAASNGSVTFTQSEADLRMGMVLDATSAAATTGTVTGGQGIILGLGTL